MNNMERITQDIFLLKIPFMSVFTSVFFICDGKSFTVYDTATTNEDAEQYIIPAIREFEKEGYTFKNIVVSHFHGDHAGGLGRLHDEFPHVKIYAGDGKYHENKGISPVTEVTDGERISGSICLYCFPGHSYDCTAVYDERTKTMLSADAFQGFGILIYGVNGDISAWMDSINKVKAMDVDNLITSHEYFELGQVAFGRDKVLSYLDGCENAFRRIFEFGQKCMSQGISDFSKMAQLFCSENKEKYSDFPTISGECFKNVFKCFE